MAVKHRVNHEIRVKEVRVIGPEGEQLGVLPTQDALKRAEEYGSDLVEVAPTAQPPVCRVMDYGKFKYELSKKKHASKLHQKTIHVKEVKFRPFTSQHDLEVKIRRIKTFLEKGHKAKVTLVFRGREIAHSEIGKALLAKVIEEVTPVAAIEHPARFEGRNMIMVLMPK